MIKHIIILFCCYLLLPRECFSLEKKVDENSQYNKNASACELTLVDNPVSCNDTCQRAINTWPVTALSENWFNITSKSCTQQGITYLRPGLGCIIQSQHDNKQYYALKDPLASCYYRNFMDGPNEKFEIYCVNYKEHLTHKIKIYLRALKKKNIQAFNIITDQPQESMCACAIALSAKNIIALSARNINPSHTPFALFSIESQMGKACLIPISFTNTTNGLYFTKLTFINEEEIIGLQNTGKLCVITSNSDKTISVKKIAHQKKLWADGLKDFAYNTTSNELVTLDTHNNIHINELDSHTVRLKKMLSIESLKHLISAEEDAITVNQIKASENQCGIFLSFDNQTPSTRYVVLSTDCFKDNDTACNK